LLVEDNDDDVTAITRALSQSYPALVVHRLVDGVDVVPWLAQAAALPRLVLLDLSLVEFDGYAVLAAIRADPALTELPVVVLTSSTNPSDVDRCYAAGATGYLFKSVDFALLRSTLTAALQYWLREGR